jgi:hypothetical protein
MASTYNEEGGGKGAKPRGRNRKKILTKASKSRPRGLSIPIFSNSTESCSRLAA